MSVRQGGKIIADANSDLPIQAGNTGKALFTDGDTSYWKSINNGVLTLQKNGTTIDTFSADSATNKTINITVPTQASDINALPSSTKYAASVSLTIDNSTYVVTLQLKDQDNNNIGSAQTIDLPLETMVVSGTYDDATKKIILTLQNGQTIEFSVADLVSGLQTEITPSNKLDADLVDDTTSTNKFVTASDKTTWNGKQDALVSGTNIKTINSQSLLGSGDIVITGGSGDIDELTITKNSDDEIQTVATINANTAVGATNPIYDWIGTYAEFTAQNIAIDHPDWLCFITDDSAPTAGIYTAAQCDALFARTSDTYTKIESNTLLSNKANTDADNFTPAGTTALSKLGYFGERYEQIRLLGNGTNYVAPANGWFTLEGIIADIAGNRLYLLLRSNNDYMAVNKSAAMALGALAGYRRYVSVPVRKGDTVFVTYESTSTAPDFSLRFYYAEGNTDYTPPAHTLVEYIAGTSNTQYIRTNIKLASDMHVYCKAKITGASSSFLPFGVRNATYDGAQFNINITNQTITIDWFGGSNVANRWTFNTTIAQNDVWEFEVENSVVTLTRNGTVVGTRTFTPTGTVSRELYLTGLNNNGVPGGAGTTGQLHAFKIWDGDNNLIMDMQPAKDESNVACMYNAVMQTLYYNAGTGTYTAGPDINE